MVRRGSRLLLWIAALIGAVTPIARAGDKPNIVYILADDLGWKDVGFHGSDIRTPSLDELAATGARLEQFYVEPMCTPTRAALMTGRYPLRYGLQTVVIPSAGTYGLPTDERTLPEALRDAGYETSIVGKWHLGHADRKYWPRQRGFDHQYGPLLGEIDYFTQEAHGRRDWFREEVPVADSGYATTLLGDEAVRLIRAHDGKKPLFVYLAFTAPHAPYQAPQADLDAYASIADPARRAYAAMVTAMDREIGRVVAALDEKGMRDDTLIVFHSDNGGPRSAKFTGEVDTSKATIPCDNGPYRDGKGMLYEGGTRVVSLVNWPGHVQAGLVVDEVVHVVDMLPTLAKLGGAPAGKGKPLDGVDVWPTLSAGAASPRKDLVYNVEPFRAAVRKGDWKLVWRTVLPSRVELFDVAKDPNETTNVAAAHPDKVAELQRWAEQLAGESAPPLFLQAVSDVALRGLMSSVSLPEDVESLRMQP
jgi:arylsulfatase A-like enzyme